MKGRTVRERLADQPEIRPEAPVGGFIVMDGEQYYRIAAYDRMPPFLVSLASDTDLWMFVASGGGLTAGRVDADGSLFPYRTVDQLHEAHHHTGPVTLIRVEPPQSGPVHWEPFSEAGRLDSAIERNLYKNASGHRLVFEEINHDLLLAFRYSWASCDEFGWVRSVTLENLGSAPVPAAYLDGVRNILPYGAPLGLYQQSSNLVDAYKKTEVDPDTGLGIFSLTAGITDRAEALEVLRANTIWCAGLTGHRVHLSGAAVDAFRGGRVMAQETLLNGARGNYLVSGRLVLDAGESSQWHLVCDSGCDHIKISELRHLISGDPDLQDRMETGLRQSGENLRRNVGSSDGLQLTGRAESWGHHFSNVLFNNLRGGVFDRNYDVPMADFIDLLTVRDRTTAARFQARLAQLPDRVTVQELRALARDTEDADFERLSHEYLPLYFGRRHGDPSRPWNLFSIKVRNPDGSRALNYEGNWRDIFQNWEALCASFPGFLPSIVAKFVNASTVDGFNPYRVTRDGVDWETVSPEDPWSNIGYWGDHQIIYLLKLLEALDKHDPEAVRDMLGTEIFSYAEVPYQIRSYAEILQDPQATIEFDTARADRIDVRVAAKGTDGKLLTGPDKAVYHANLLEKLLVPALSKISNMVPDAGIWMNTQRPEWNDANNALVGGGVSVVTLCYLRRYLVFLADLLEQDKAQELPVAREIVRWFDRVVTALEAEKGLLAQETLDPMDRKRFMDALGEAFSDYRDIVYAHGFSGKTDFPVRRAAELCRLALQFVDRDIAANRREDGLYHTYNLLEISDDEQRVEVAHLQEMLEGQVAVLSSGVPTPEAALDIVERLFESRLYKASERSFILYPERTLPGFLAKNRVPSESVNAIALLRDLLVAADQRLVSRDTDGVFRFHGDLGKADDLAAALDDLAAEADWSEAVTRDREAVLDLFEDVFNHKSYTGRSGVMYAYEGLGCIYWHMVAKLLLAVQETILRAEREGCSEKVTAGLAKVYFRIRAGIGYEKSAAEYGAFPIDPYSHTPSGGGAKQPGMTGQVKEEILTRMGELGIRVEAGTICFQPSLLDAGEFLQTDRDFQYFDVTGEIQTLALTAGSLAFTYCQVPVVYELTDGDGALNIAFSDGSSVEQPVRTLEAELGTEIHARSGRVDGLRVLIPRSNLYLPGPAPRG